MNAMMDESLSLLFTALSAFQGELDNVEKGKSNPGFKGAKYADLASVWDVIRAPLAKHGLAIVQLPCPAKEGHVGLMTVITHKSGTNMLELFEMPVRDATNPQAVGSALTYARRYALMGACGIAPTDDDGNEAAAKPEPTYYQAFNQAIKQVSENVRLFNVLNLEEQVDLEALKAIYLATKALSAPLGEASKVKAEALNVMGTIISGHVSKEGKK